MSKFIVNIIPLSGCALISTQYVTTEKYTIDLFEIKEYNFEIIEHKPYSKVFILRTGKDKIQVFEVPYDYNTMTFLLPDLQWSNLSGCENFGPDQIEGRIVNQGYFRCNDEQLSDWWKNRWMWDLEGKNISNDIRIDDLSVPSYRIDNSKLSLYLYKM